MNTNALEDLRAKMGGRMQRLIICKCLALLITKHIMLANHYVEIY